MATAERVLVIAYSYHGRGKLSCHAELVSASFNLRKERDIEKMLKQVQDDE